MGSKSSVSESVTFKYIFSDDYNPTYANGAIGGLTPTGEIVINFYHERLALPNTQTFAIVPQLGALGEEISATPEDHRTSYVRFVQSGVTLDVERAKDVHQWLGEQIATAEKVKSAKSQSH